MDEEELASLAASIEANGLRDPISMGRVNGADTEMLVDGRNRLRACEIAGVEPRFETIEFENDEAVKAYVADKSEHRNLTKAQQAMRLALLYPEPDKRGRGNKGKAAETADFSQRRLREARTVLAFSREWALAVRDGSRKLDEVLKEVQEARRNLETVETKMARLRAEAPDLAELVTEERDERLSLDEAIAKLERRKIDETQFALIRESAPDLAQLVDEDRMPLSEACAALEQRKQDAEKVEASKRETIFRVTSAAYNNILALGVSSFMAGIYERINDADFRTELAKQMRVTAEKFSSIEDGAAALAQLVEALTSGGTDGNE